LKLWKNRNYRFPRRSHRCRRKKITSRGTDSTSRPVAPLSPSMAATTTWAGTEPNLAGTNTTASSRSGWPMSGNFRQTARVPPSRRFWRPTFDTPRPTTARTASPRSRSATSGPYSSCSDPPMGGWRQHHLALLLSRLSGSSSSNVVTRGSTSTTKSNASSGSSVGRLRTSWSRLRSNRPSEPQHGTRLGGGQLQEQQRLRAAGH